MQLEYAMEAINNAASAIGILTQKGVVLACEKRATSKLLVKSELSDKIYKIDEHIVCAVAGLTSDANILLDQARRASLGYTYRFQEPQPVEQLIKILCNTKQGYTQFGGLRPFGVSFLYAGWDENFGFQLYHSDPSGNYGGWKATAIGNNNQTAKDKLKTEFKDDLSINDALKLSASVLSKTMDVSPSVERMEFAVLTRNEDTGVVSHHLLTEGETKTLLDIVEAEAANEGDS
jgi:20S proteasome subunit alpha 3